MTSFTDNSDKSVKRVGDITQEPATNEATDPSEASKIANLLEGLTFPATKEQIKNYIANGKSIAISGESARTTSQYIEDNLQDRKKYNSTYEVEKALGLIIKKDNGKDINKDKKRTIKETNNEGKNVEVTPYTRDKALNRANKKRLGEKTRTDPHDIIAEGHEEMNPK